mmetsp:Transcript_11532/g.43248  ORF Transcript_11532/g.43248 Transcript_11532/m.43248 type:complete len:254 (+) Transcript_11532:264-1025(+)
MGTIVSKQNTNSQNPKRRRSLAGEQYIQHRQLNKGALREGEILLKPVEVVANEIYIIDGTAYHKSLVPEGLLQSYQARYREQQFRLKQVMEKSEQRNHKGKPYEQRLANGGGGGEHYKADQVQVYHSHGDEPPSDTDDYAAVIGAANHVEGGGSSQAGLTDSDVLPSVEAVKRKDDKHQTTSTFVTPIDTHTISAASLGIRDASEDEGANEETVSHPSTPQDTYPSNFEEEEDKDEDDESRPSSSSISDSAKN